MSDAAASTGQAAASTAQAAASTAQPAAGTGQAAAGTGQPAASTAQPAASTAQRDLRRAFSMFPSGVVGVCALVDAAPVGMTASSFTSVSLQPPLVSFCIDQRSTTWPVLARAPRLGISVLSSEHAELARALSAHGRDRFSGVRWQSGGDGALFLHGATLWLDCTVSEAITAGDHFIVLLDVLGTRLFPDLSPLIFHRSELRALDSGS